MRIVYTVIVHILLTGSIFVTYFHWPVHTNLQPQPPISAKAPAQRLVLIVADGLRAESLFNDNCANMPHLKEMILNLPLGGLVGISEAGLPTESWSGHIALTAGFNVDLLTVARWTDDPIEFDTVFNRSRKTYAWGSNDVLHIFSRLAKDKKKRYVFDSYCHDMETSCKDKTYDLDRWVFAKVEKLLEYYSRKLQYEKRVIFFLHLLGLETAGRVHKPGSELFLQNLFYTQEAIVRMYDMFESTFPDGKTTYILTSDHGMTNAGTYGSGEVHETETPFIIWGSGIHTEPFETNKSLFIDTNRTLPLYRIDQIQLAPLISALLGIATPVNNLGILPGAFLDTTSEYKYLAAQNNAFQLAEKYRAVLEQHERGWFTPWLPKYQADIQAIKDLLESEAQLRHYSHAQGVCYALMEASLNGIDYYSSYYRWPLLGATAATFLGFLAHLLMIFGDIIDSKDRPNQYGLAWGIFIACIGLVVFGFCFLQQLPYTISLYLLLPVVVWYTFLRYKPLNLKIICNVKWVLLFMFCCGLLLGAFFERRAVSVAFFLHGLCEKISQARGCYKRKFFSNLLFTVILALCPLLPPISGNFLIYIGISVIVLRSFMVRKIFYVQDKIMVYSALANGVLCIYMDSQQLRVFLISHVISWVFLGYVLIVLLRSAVVNAERRMERLFFLLGSLYALLCSSYEPLFLVLLLTDLIFTVNDDKTSFSHDSMYSNPVPSLVKLYHMYRYAIIVIVYSFMSFFGTGNWASLSAYDPNIIRCFLLSLSPVGIMFLVVLKHAIPIILVMVVTFASSHFVQRYERGILICVLIICNVLSMHLLFLVKYQGSWLEISTSVSRFVVMQLATVAMAIFLYSSKIIIYIPDYDRKFRRNK